MKSTITLLSAGALALGATFVTVDDAEAGHRRGHRVNPVPAIIGGVIGGIILNEALRDRDRNYYYGGYPHAYSYGYYAPRYGAYRYDPYYGRGWRHRYGNPYAPGGGTAPEGSVTR